jgi:hypothetical protein
MASKQTLGARTGQRQRNAKRTTAQRQHVVSRAHFVVPGSRRMAPKLAIRVRNVDPKDRIEVNLDLRAPALAGPFTFTGPCSSYGVASRLGSDAPSTFTGQGVSLA